MRHGVRFPSPLKGEGQGGVARNIAIEDDPYPLACASRWRATSPLQGEVKKENYAIFTYSNSPGLLSMPTLGGAIQLVNLPASNCGCIRLSMKSRSSSDGR